MKRNVLIFTMMLVALMTVSSARAKEAYAIFNTAKVKVMNNMFYGCESLVGGNGTVYDPYYVDSSYAIVDGDEGEGYLTGKEGIATGIEAVNNKKPSIDAPMFNLQGQRVNDSYKGVVIQNGRKVLKK